MRRFRRPAPLGITLLLLLPACASDPVLENGVWHSARTGFRIAEPVAIGDRDARWERYDLEGAALAYRHGDLETLSLQARCGRPLTIPAIMARHLVIGIPERTLREGGPRQIAGQSGWGQTLDARLGQKTVRIKTLTFVAADCVYDLLLVTEGEFEPAEKTFDAWAESFSLDASEVAGGSE